MRRVERKWQCPGSTPNSPSDPGAMTSSTCRLNSCFSGVTTSKRIFPAIFLLFSPLCTLSSGVSRMSSIARMHRPQLHRGGCASTEDILLAPLNFHSHLFRLRHRFFDRADHIERLLRQVIVLAVEDLFEAADRIFEFDVLAGGAGKCFGDVKGLREEALDLPGASHDHFVV